jgi:DNA-binding winged helix-turn-helix (wHTH) protein
MGKLKGIDEVEFRAFIDAGHSCSRLAKHYGVNKSAICRSRIYKRVKHGIDDTQFISKPKEKKIPKRKNYTHYLDTKYNREAFLAAIGNSYNSTNVAYELGCSKRAVNALAKIYGINMDEAFVGKIKTVRSSVQNMPPLDAVEYLLQFIESHLPDYNAQAKVLQDKFKLPRSNAMVLSKLWSYRGKPLSREDIITAILSRTDSVADYKTIDVYIVRLRKTIKQYQLPITIRTIYGYGYILDVLDPNFDLITTDSKESTHATKN